MARPTKLDDIRCKRIVDAIAAGVSQAGAARMAGIAESTLQNWIARGRDGEPMYEEFVERLRKAEGDIEGIVVTALLKAIDGGHVGAMSFWLERRRHREWGKRDTVTYEHNDAEGKADGTDLEVAESVVAALKSRVA